MIMELPRILDVSELVSASAPELESLLGQVRFATGEAFGYPSLSRHLRRRATSHNRYLTKRRPNVRLAKGYPKRRRSNAEVTEAQQQQQQHEHEVCVSHVHLLHGSPSMHWQRPKNRAQRRATAASQLPRPRGCPAGFTDASPAPGACISTADAVEGALKSSEGGRAWRLETHQWHAKRMHMQEQ